MGGHGGPWDSHFCFSEKLAWRLQTTSLMSVVLHPDNGPVLSAATEVHRRLGPGLLESSYKICLAYELQRSEIPFAIEVPVPLIYREIRLDCGYRLDFLVNGDLILEVKSVAHIEPVHVAQVMTYLRLSGARQAFLINFNALSFTAGLRSFLGKGKQVPEPPPRG